VNSAGYADISNVQLGHNSQIMLQWSLSIIADETFFPNLGNSKFNQAQPDDYDDADGFLSQILA
jgi:hypothetical protein